MALITMDEAIDWGRRGELCDLMTDADQRQVAEWLDGLRELEAENARLRSCLSDDADNARQIMGENARLREERDTYRDLVDNMVHPDIPDQLAAENAKLRKELESVGTAAYLYGRSDLKAENAKLHELLSDAPKCGTCEAMLDCDECLRADGSHKERRRLSAENAKLREKVRQDHDFMVHLNMHEAYPSSADIAVNVAELSELGVEVE